MITSTSAESPMNFMWPDCLLTSPILPYLTSQHLSIQLNNPHYSWNTFFSSMFLHFPCFSLHLWLLSQCQIYVSTFSLNHMCIHMYHTMYSNYVLLVCLTNKHCKLDRPKTNCWFLVSVPKMLFPVLHISVNYQFIIEAKNPMKQN